jgi:hypothetical protein
MEQQEQTSRSQTLPAEEPEKGFVSAGQRVHHWGSYLGVDWIFNGLCGAAFTHWAKETPSGQALWSKPVNWLLGKVLPVFIKEDAALVQATKRGNTFFGLVAGGMFTIPPLMALENKVTRRKIITTVDETIYGKEAVEHDPKFKQSYDALDNEPQKDFTIGMAARFVALTPLVIAILRKDSSDYLDKKVFSKVANLTKSSSEKMGLSAKTFFKSRTPEEADRVWKQAHDNLGTDLSLGIPYAVMHSAAYNTLNKVFGKREKKAEVLPQAGFMTASAAPEVGGAQEKALEPHQAAPRSRISQAAPSERVNAPEEKTLTLNA